MPDDFRTRSVRPRLPARAYSFLILLYVASAIIFTSLLIYAWHTRLGYSYAVHSTLFFPFSPGNRWATGAGMVGGAILAYMVSRVLVRRQDRGLKLVPWVVQAGLALFVVVYVMQVLEINISLSPVEETAKQTTSP